MSVRITDNHVDAVLALDTKGKTGSEILSILSTDSPMLKGHVVTEILRANGRTTCSSIRKERAIQVVNAWLGKGRMPTGRLTDSALRAASKAPAFPGAAFVKTA